MSAEANAWLPQPLRKLAGRALQGALAHALALDPDTRRELATLDGRSVQMHLRGPELAFAVTATDGGLRVGPAQGEESLRVATTPGALLALAFKRDDGHIAPGKIDISGDAGLARQLEKLLRNFAPDVEEAFTRVFGDVLGVPVARVAHGALRHVRDSAEHLREDGADWLRDEARLVMGPGELEGFLDEVDAVRERSERLQARVARLAARARGTSA
ncbi:MAG: SCP2 sterol-binding domain-containing protein [Xanthomonadales bacterium]|nr:SCP2 sterol-binding domain-containing protein [Xanthomonadales bacterium]